MSSKPLTPAQVDDAARMKAAFLAWQQRRRAAHEPSSQEAAAHELGFGQSALNQYIGGNIPLNFNALQKMAALFGVTPASVSPGLIAAAQNRIAELTALAGTPPARIGADRDKPGLVKSSDQKERSKTKTKTKGLK